MTLDNKLRKNTDLNGRPPWLIATGVGLLTFLTRLPFVGSDVGVDPDAWRVAIAAQKISTTGEYAYSRPPGFPVHEFASALLIPLGPSWLNIATALMSAASVTLFILILQRIGSRHALWGGLALAFTPIIYMNSTLAMDYMWAVAFILLSLYLLLREKRVLSGIALGLAIGCRLTSGVMLIPLIMILSLSWEAVSVRERLRSILELALPAGATAAMLFLPAYLTYGTGFVRFYDTPPPALHVVMKMFTYDAWGGAGTLALALIGLLLLVAPGLVTEPDPASRSARRFLRPAGAAIILVVIAFLRLPVEAPYLIAAIPFVILILAVTVRRAAMVTLCVVLAVSCFIDIRLDPPISVRTGIVLQDHAKRQRNQQFVERIMERAETLPEKSVVVVAWWEPQLLVLRDDPENTNLKYVYYLNQGRVDLWGKQGYSFYHLPAVEQTNLTGHGVDLSTVSTPLDIPY